MERRPTLAKPRHPSRALVNEEAAKFLDLCSSAHDSANPRRPPPPKHHAHTPRETEPRKPIACHSTHLLSGWFHPNSSPQPYASTSTTHISTSTQHATTNARPAAPSDQDRLQDLQRAPRRGSLRRTHRQDGQGAGRRAKVERLAQEGEQPPPFPTTSLSPPSKLTHQPPTSRTSTPPKPT